MSEPGTLPEPALLFLRRVKETLAALGEGQSGVVSLEVPDGVMLDDNFLERVRDEGNPTLLHIKLTTAGRTLIVEHMPSHVHQTASTLLFVSIWMVLMDADLHQLIRSTGATRQVLVRTSGQESKKEPDESFLPWGRHPSLGGKRIAPTVVVEVGAFETDAGSRTYSQRWFSSPATKMIVNVVIVVSIRILDGVLAVRTVTFVREHPQPQTTLSSGDVALVEPEALKHTWTEATPWPHDFILPAAWFFDWEDSALGQQRCPCPDVHKDTNLVVTAADMNDWCQAILEAHEIEPLQ